MKTNKKILGGILGVILGGSTLALAGPLPEGWESKQDNNLFSTIMSYPKAPGKTNADYEKPRKAGITSAAAVITRHENLKEVLPSLATEGLIYHYVVSSDGHIYKWLDIKYQARTMGSLNNHALTVLIETPKGLTIKPGEENHYTREDIVKECANQAITKDPNGGQWKTFPYLLEDLSNWNPAIGNIDGFDDYYHAASLRDGINPQTGKWSEGYISNLDEMRARWDGPHFQPLTKEIVQKWTKEDAA